MQMPIGFIPAPPRVVRPPKRRAAPAAVAPTLVAATYDEGHSVTLTFDRAVNVGGLVGANVVVNDNGSEVESRLAGTGTVVVLSPTSVRIGLVSIGPSTHPGTTLDVTASNGIVAVGGGAWTGVANLTLPFG